MNIRNIVFVLLIVLLIGFLVISKRRNIFKERWQRISITIFVKCIIFLLIFSIAVFPDLGTIETTGKYESDSVEMELVDEARDEVYENGRSPRKLPVLVVYPKAEDIPDHSLPLIVFSHGGMSFRDANLSLFQELASHGYVVASIDHPYEALFTKVGGKSIFIDGGYMKELSSDDYTKNIENSFHLYQKWMKIRTEDIHFVVHELRERTQEKEDVLRLIDSEKLGLAGHSMGGAGALGTARQCEKVKAVLALESPYLYDILGVEGEDFIWNNSEYNAAMLNIYSDSAYPILDTDKRYAQNKKYLYNKDKVGYYYIEGSNHYSMTDLSRFSPFLCTMLGGSYEKSGAETLKIINNKSLEFFNQYLKE